jgi:inosine/xanthosine triphosphatase
MRKIIVASTNPVKVNAALAGFKAMFPDEQFEIEGVSAPSGVSDQPRSDTEAFQGAVNRTENVSKEKPDADFWISFEAGIEEVESEMEAFAWAVVKSNKGRIGKGKTGTFFLPPQITELIKQGKELGEADDIVFGRTNSKQSNGAIGLLTHDLLTRTTFYAEAAMLALIPFVNESLYFKEAL